MKILITGGSSGIGFLTGCVLSERGHEVILTAKTDLEVEIINKKVAMLELSVSVLKLDVTDSADRKNISSVLKDVDVLFLHAGIGNVGLVFDMDIDLIKETFEVNVFSNLRLIQLFLGKNNDNKKIIMTSSLLSGKSLPFFSSYSMTKSCIDIIIKTLRKENLFNNNKFILIKPGAYHTGFNQYMILSGEKSNLSANTIGFLNKIFLCFEEKKLNSIVYKIVIAIEKGNCCCYYAPFYQKVLMSLIR